LFSRNQQTETAHLRFVLSEKRPEQFQRAACVAPEHGMTEIPDEHLAAAADDTVHVLARELGFSVAEEAGELLHLLRPEGGVDAGSLKETLRRPRTGPDAGGLHALLDLEDDFVLARPAQVGQVEIFRLGFLQERLGEGPALVDAQGADEERDGGAVDLVEVGQERFQRFLDRGMTAHAAFVEEIDRLPPDELAAAEERKGEDGLAHFLDGARSVIDRVGAAVDDLEIHGVRGREFLGQRRGRLLHRVLVRTGEKMDGDCFRVASGGGHGFTSTMEHLWAPWRNLYVKHPQEKPGGDVFAEIAQSSDDEGNFVLARGKSCFALLNLYPYSTAHLMVVPYRATADLDDLGDDELLELMTMLRRMKAAVTAALEPHGFNVGINIGAAGGAGIASHLHVHLVPRWRGDANFMTTTAETRVHPSDLASVYKMIREKIV
jgi:ATP adenylyltransferase